ncbi:MAG: DJ-1/PfpI family protein [Pseudonocardiales bacterium]
MATDGVERVELEQPRGALYGAGGACDLLSIHPGEIEARQFDRVSAGTFAVDRMVSDASVDDYDALLLPGGTVNPDALRINSDAVAFVKDFVATGKPVASICHGPWTLLEADAVRGRRLASWPSLWTDARHRHDPAGRLADRLSCRQAEAPPSRWAHDGLVMFNRPPRWEFP